MDQYEFEKYLDNQTEFNSNAPVGRFVKNIFNVEERVVLPKNYWRYIDWVETDQGQDMAAWIKQCDSHREDKPLSENLMEWVYWDMCDRVKNDDPFPEFLDKPTV